jgi:hypothetical protein
LNASSAVVRLRLLVHPGVALVMASYDCVRSRGPRQEVTFVVQDDGPVGLDLVRVRFDDERAVSDAGLMLLATLAARLGIEESARSGSYGFDPSGRAWAAPAAR